MASHPDISVLLGSYPTLDEIPVKWYFARPEHIDRAKEASADVMLLQNNCLTLRDYFAREGKDWRAELKQIALERKTMQELGIGLEDVYPSLGDEGSNDETDSI